MAGKRPNITEKVEIDFTSDEASAVFDVTGVDDASVQVVAQSGADPTNYISSIEVCVDAPDVAAVYSAPTGSPTFSASDVTGGVQKLVALQHTKLRVRTSTAGTSGKGWVVCHQRWSVN